MTANEMYEWMKIKLLVALGQNSTNVKQKIHQSTSIKQIKLKRQKIESHEIFFVMTHGKFDQLKHPLLRNLSNGKHIFAVEHSFCCWQMIISFLFEALMQMVEFETKIS